ncbi:transcriptional activator NhaR [Pseudogulbenkiania subflava]|uniref:LysR family transcriptional regulator, transcriptional activator of nhaA n=1 Tax=Pseudogulbenkiania subflava DSM 22618 TaxID=1123014 RepID=A0A1Y6C6W5_9NEIS|nr:transcriptional activator NhaR [Pseudogulbenkiania subflava]SMF48439.1 LysR family transcriptional regulator, transcriptional activator of nhaA [Pseudogulbenkiania subflava DSM 22618]
MKEILNYKHLHYFWAVAREGGVNRAAERLGMSAQTVSGQVSKLEHALGKALFTQQGRNLVLTEAGRVALQFADQIFMLGEALQETLEDDTLGSTVRLAAGITDVLPKTVSYRLLEPVLGSEQRVRLICTEGAFDELLAELALHRLDVVLADRPVPAGGQQPFVSTLMARCPVMIFGTDKLCSQYREGFPLSLSRAPMLLPTRDNVLRSQLEQWFEEQNIKVDIVGEFEDGALLKTFGRQGVGLFPAPSFQVDDITRQFEVEVVGEVTGVYEHYYAIANRRKLQHSAVETLMRSATEPHERDAAPAGGPALPPRAQ